MLLINNPFIEDKISICKLESDIKCKFGSPFKEVASNLILTKVHNVLKEKHGFREIYDCS